MKRVIFAGTSEGRILCKKLSDAGMKATVCVATEYGKDILPEMPGISVHTGRMDAAEMTAFLRGTELVIDATHPYAVEVSKNIRKACAEVSCQYIRLLRPRTKADGAIYVKNSAEAAAFLENTIGNILLTVGSKELHCFTAMSEYKTRCYPRVLPAEESFQICKKNGFLTQNIVMMQGPFSEEMNTALLHSCHAKWLVTKDTGAAGGLPEKLAAAEKCGCKVVMIERPQEDGMTPDEVAALLLPKGKNVRFPLFVDLSGRKCLVVGCGKIGAHRAEVLQRYGAEVVVVAPDGIAPDGVEHIHRKFQREDLDEVFLVTAATDDRSINHMIYTLCVERNIFISTADNQKECTFFFPAVRIEDNISVGLVSDGSDHKKTARIAKKIEAILKEDDG